MNAAKGVLFALKTGVAIEKAVSLTFLNAPISGPDNEEPLLPLWADHLAPALSRGSLFVLSAPRRGRRLSGARDRPADALDEFSGHQHHECG